MNERSFPAAAPRGGCAFASAAQVLAALAALVLLLALAALPAQRAWAADGLTAGTVATDPADGAGAAEKPAVAPAPKKAPAVRYRVYVQKKGAQAVRKAGKTAGTTGKSLRLEALTAWLDKGGYAGGMEYKAKMQKKGWSKKWVKAGKQVGAKGKGLRLEAFKVRLTGEVARYYDVEYRAYVQNIGWQAWAANGGTAGTGKGLRVEALQMRLVKKGAAASVKNGVYVVTAASNASAALSASGTAVKKASLSKTADAQKFYVRNENGGMTLQSVSTGKFLADAGGPTLQKYNAKSAAQVWTATRDGGMRLANKATGRVLKLSGSALSADATGGGLSFVGTKLVNDGTYVLKNAAKGMVLDVKGASYSSGANIMVGKANKGGNQVFSFKNRSGGWCRVTNVMSGLGVDVKKGAKKNGANVRQAGSGKAASQQWKPMLERNGTFYLINRASGKALTAAGNAANGKNVTSSVYKGAARQRWSLKKGSWSLTGNAKLDRFVNKIAVQNGRDLRRCFNWMGSLRHVQQVDGRRYRGIMSNKVLTSYAVHAMNGHKADCYVDAAMFCYLARACGYQANMRAGGCPSRGGGTVPHGWTEVYRNGTTYVCDPNLRRDLPSYNWYMNTYGGSPVTYSR